MKKFRLTNSIESPAPSAKNLMYLSNALSKWQWFFLIVTILLVAIGFYHIGKFIGKKSESKPKKKRRYAYTNYTSEEDQGSSDDDPTTYSSDSTE